MLMMLILQVLLYKWSSGSPGLHDSENSSEVSLRVSVWPAGWLSLSSVWLQYQHDEVGPGEHDGQDGAVRQQPGEPRHWEDWGLFLWEEEDWGSVVRALTQVSHLRLRKRGISGIYHVWSEWEQSLEWKWLETGLTRETLFQISLHSARFRPDCDCRFFQFGDHLL